MAFGVVPLVVVPGADAAGKAQLETSPARAIDGKLVPSLSTSRSVTYATEKGYVTRLFGRPINVKDDKGQWQRIDNKLRAVGDRFENGLGTFDLSIPGTLAAPVKLAHEGAELSLKLRGSDAAAKISGASATFAGAGKNVAAKLTANNEALKEDLILADASSQTTFVYDLGLSAGLKPVERPDGGLDIVDASGEITFTAAAPVASDDKGDLAPKSATSLKVSKEASGWVLTLTLDQGWLAESGRAFPVTLDPSFALGATRDCYTDQQDATTNFCGSGELWAGRSGSGHNHNALTYFNVAGTVPAGALVQRASLVLYPLYQSSPGTAKTLAAREVTTDWDNNATWTKRTASANWTTAGGDLAGSDLSTQPLPAAGAYSAFTVTDAVASWVANKSVNRGIAITDNGSTANNAQIYASADWSDSSKWPSLEIEYQGRLGSLPSYTIDREQITDRQSVGVNVAGGNLLLESSDLRVSGTGLPLDVKRVYNSQEPWDGQLGVGGARISLGEDVKLYTCDDAGSKCLIGVGGYRAVFKYNATTGKYTTPPGIGNVTLTKQTTGDLNFILTDNKSGVKMQFFNASFAFLNRVEDKNGNAISIDHLGAFGNISKIKDTHGREYPVQLNGGGYISSIDVPASINGTSSTWKWEYGYNAYNFLTSVKDPEGKITSYDYASNDKINKITDPRGNDTLITYDSSLRVTSVTRKIDGTTANDITTTYAYSAPDGTWCKAATPTAPNDPEQQGVGVTTVTDPRGKTTKYCWNSQGAVVKARDHEGRDVSTTYTPAGNSLSLGSIAAGTSNPYATTSYTYSGGGAAASDKITQILEPGKEKTTIGYQTTGTDVDQAQPNEIKDAQGNLTKYTYDASANVTSIESRRLTTGAATLQATLNPDPTNKSRLASSVQNGLTTTYQYDSVKKDLKKVIPHNSTIVGETEFATDGLSRVTQSKDGRASQWVNFTYDKVSRQLTAPDSDGENTTVTYDGNGNPITRSAPGQYSTYTYDKLNRKTSETLNGVTTSYTYDKASNLLTLTDASGTTTYEYDNVNRLAKIKAPPAAGGADDTTSYTYTDPDSSASTPVSTVLATLPGSGKIKQTLDTSGKLREVLVTNSGGTQTLKQSFTYNDAGAHAATGDQSLLTSTALQNGGTGATVIGRQYKYTPASQVSEVKALSGGSTVDTTTFTYDGSGNRLTRVKTPVSGSPTTTTYAYNTLNQLCWQANVASANPCATAPSGATSYTYDKAGNQLTGGYTGSWDAKGRIDGYNGVYSSILSPNNNEIVGLGSGNTFTNTQLGVQRIEMGGNLTKLVRDPGGAAVSQIRDSAKHWFVTDQIGSTIALVSGTGSVDRTFSYDIDGNSVAAPASGPDTWVKFAGGHDIGGGLYHFGARFYQPSSARWTQMDPLLQPADLGQVNRYSYVGGNPVNKVDPSGLKISLNKIKDLVETEVCYIKKSTAPGDKDGFYDKGGITDDIVDGVNCLNPYNDITGDLPGADGAE